MPGPFIHISSMKHTATMLAGMGDPYKPATSRRGKIDPTWSGNHSTIELGQIMLAAPNFASLGAIGPDLFFFLPDFRNKNNVPISGILVTVLNTLEALYAAVDPYVTKYEQYLGPISEDTAEEMDRLTGGLSETVGNISGDLSSILITFLETFVTEQADFFGYFSLGLDNGFDEQAYLWSDMLHYRDTGQFARAIWQRADASGDDQLRAYALGYQTHVATDVTGHAFVNVIAGGPFRMHWQRHHLVENHMDSFWYLNDALGPKSGTRYPQLTESALYYDIGFGDGNAPMMRPAYPTGATLRENWTRQRLLDQDPNLPKSIANLLLDAMGDIWYSAGSSINGEHPKILSEDGRPTVETITEAYDLFFRYLKYVTVDGFNHEPPDPPELFPSLLDFPVISEPQDASGDSAPGDSSDDGNFWDDILDFFLAVIRDIEYLVEVGVYLASLPWDILAGLVTYPLRLGLYYSLELPLFNLLKSFRQTLVMTGYMLPMDDEISGAQMTIGASSASGFSGLLDSIGDTFGGLLPPIRLVSLDSFRDAEYPRSIVVDESKPPAAIEYKSPWNFPTSPTELHNQNLSSEAAPAAPVLSSAGTLAGTGGPYPAMSDPTVLFGGVNQDPHIRDRFEAARTPGDADAVGMDITPTRHLGDCVAFSQYYLWRESRSPMQKDGTSVPVVEWNLDSDMGYGYHCWDWNRVSNEKSADMPADPNGHSYATPCTAPEQSALFPGNTGWNPAARLKIHWVGPGPDPEGVSPLPDPGCSMDAPPKPRGRGPSSRRKPAAARRRPSRSRS